MTPFDAASALANIVGLLATFAQSRATTRDSNHREFLEWLHAHHHDEVIQKISCSIGLQQQIDELLRRNHGELLQKMETANEMLATVLSKIEGLDKLAAITNPGTELSEQALFFLQQLSEADKNEMILPDVLGTPIFYNGAPVSFHSGNEKFIEDDLDTLVAFDFFKGGITEQGDRTFRITRKGQAYHDAVSGKGKCAS